MLTNMHTAAMRTELLAKHVPKIRLNSKNSEVWIHGEQLAAQAKLFGAFLR